MLKHVTWLKPKVCPANVGTYAQHVDNFTFLQNYRSLTPGKHLTFSFIWLLLCLGMLPPSHADENDRTQFGQNAYPIWSPLSFFESQTIAERHAAQSGDPDALLALYILASGRFGVSDYTIIKQQIDGFTKAIRVKTDGLIDPWQQGELLNGAMHHAFFKAADEEQDTQQHKPSSNYELDQSTLAGIFQNHTYNCISSSLLYAVLARRMGFDGLGVMLPSHAFIQLTFDNGKIAEVETTSPHGFDQHHDEAFYQKAAEAWFNPRGLLPSTYDDYLNRELIPFWQLGTRNMLHQHTHPKRMNEIDRGRLAEISAFIDPSYEPAQINRMHYYTVEASKLAEQKQWELLIRLLETVLEQLVLDTANFNQNEQLQNSYFWLNLIAIEAYAQNQQLNSTLDSIYRASSLAFDDERTKRLQNRSVDALNTLLKQNVANNEFETGIYAITAMEPYASEQPTYASAIQWFYSEWAKSHWNIENWPEVIAVLEDYLTQPYLTNDLEKTHKNLASAYNNWVLTEISQKNAGVAKAIILQCQMQHLEPSICELAATTANKALPTPQ